MNEFEMMLKYKTMLIITIFFVIGFFKYFVISISTYQYSTVSRFGAFIKLFILLGCFKREGRDGVSTVAKKTNKDYVKIERALK